METLVITRNKGKREFTQAVASFYGQELKIGHRKFNLSIRFVQGLKKQAGIRGGTIKLGGPNIEVALDSKLDLETMLTTLAHEMVHVKQYVLGQLKLRDGVYTWLGKEYDTSYVESPWEIEAFSRERLIANKIVLALGK